MLATKLVLRQPLRQVLLHRSVPALRYLSTTPTPAPRRTAIPEDSPLLQPSTLSVWFEKHPKIGQAVFNFLGRMGAFSPKNSVRHRSLHLYSRLIATVPDLEKDFWFNECDLPPTFQSWFTVANLHIWMLTVRLRALPKKYGRVYVQAVTDQFFFDIEDRIRNILQPQWKPRPPYTFTTDFYQNPNAPKPGQTPDNTQLSRAPDQQWNGLMVAMDMSLIRGDTEMASAIWRNILGARGAKGIAFPGDPAKFRRSINYAGSDINKLEKMNVEEEELKDDGSGVHDFPP
ncbi:hypothetical protein DL96DRAFT_1600977 [Flagelloscypha sp. PMI_526]|nr:hypothetical protein DL96DRAFT_1600977 [Flagelloscypha sp. PMI_526]